MPRTITLKEAQASYSTIVEQVESTGEPLIVEKDGKPTVVVISFAEYQRLVALREDETKSAQQIEREMLLRHEIAAFDQMKPELMKTHLNKWVAILNGHLVDFGDDRRVLSKRITDKFNNRVVLIEQVLLEPRIFVVDSPERTRG
jgi:prevent-host-death family protein